MKFALTRPKFLMIIRRALFHFEVLSDELIERVSVEVVELQLSNQRQDRSELVRLVS